MGFGDLPQHLHRLALAAEGAEQLPDHLRFDLAFPHQLDLGPGVRGLGDTPGTKLTLVAQTAVVDRLHLLDQSRFEQQGAEIASGLAPFHALDLLRDAHLLGRAVVAAEMRQYPAAHVDALADVEGQLVLAVKEIHARPLR